MVRDALAPPAPSIPRAMSFSRYSASFRSIACFLIYSLAWEIMFLIESVFCSGGAGF